MNEVIVNIGYYPGDGTVSKKGGKYYYTSESTKITLTEETYSSENCVYKKLIHRPKEHLRVKNIYYNGGWTYFFPTPGDHFSVTVYYGEHDTLHKYPLIVQLDDKDDYYTASTNQRWNKNLSITHTTLKKHLDLQNCHRASVHIVDISQTRGVSCLGKSGHQRPIVTADRSQEEHYGYTKYTHSSQVKGQFSVSAFTDNEVPQTGITPLPQSVMEINAYCPSMGPPRPILIHFKSGEDRWFRRVFPMEHNWAEIPVGTKDRPAHKDDHERIKINLQILTSPDVTEKIEHYGTGSYSYDNHDEDVKETDKYPKNNCDPTDLQNDPKTIPSSMVAILGVTAGVLGAAVSYIGLRTYSIMRRTGSYTILGFH